MLVFIKFFVANWTLSFHLAFLFNDTTFPNFIRFEVGIPILILGSLFVVFSIEHRQISYVLLLFLISKISKSMINYSTKLKNFTHGAIKPTDIK